MCLGHGLKNLSAFVKTGETDLDRFHQFSVNRPVNLKIFEIKNSKKTRADFKIFGQNIIQKYPRARSPAPPAPPLDFAVFHWCTAGLVYRQGER
jgi:hypothetical protein